MEKIERLDYYIQVKAKHQDQLKEAKSRYRMFSIARLVAFLFVALSLYFIPILQVKLGLALVGAILFLYFVNRSLDAKYQRDKLLLFIEQDNFEIAAAKGDWTNFDDGKEFKDGKHAFSRDMDLFGPKSFFQLVNRTGLYAAKQQLAKDLAYGTSDIDLANAAIEELSKNIDWSRNFVIESMLHSKDIKGYAPLEKVKDLPQSSMYQKLMKWGVPIISFGVILAVYFDLLAVSFISYMILVNLALVGQKLKESNKVIFPLIERINQVKALHYQVGQLSRLDFQNPKFKQYCDDLLAANGAMEAFGELAKIQKRMEFRQNLLVGFALNVMLGWDFHVHGMFDKWNTKYGEQIAIWENKLAQIEAWISGAIYKFNYPTGRFTEFEETDFQITQLGHPFVAESKMITNDFHLAGQEHFLIITGPNMAGKSTYLRSVGLAILCANAGWPILANSCKMPRMKLFSSMRTSDDLTIESSYFHAELSRLRFIMDEIEKGGKVFIILDEILKGTNSKDKEIGSAKFLQKLKRLDAFGIIATHDLSLTNLASSESGFRNMYFDSTIVNDELDFTYKLNAGVCQNMNASFLLRKMNLVDE